MTSNTAYAVMRTDFLKRADDEGHNTFVSLHASPESAKAALDSHVASMNKRFKLKNPNTNNSQYSGTLYGVQVIVGDEDFHSYDVRVEQVPIEGGHIVADKHSSSTSTLAGKGKKAMGSQQAGRSTSKVKADEADDGDKTDAAPYATKAKVDALDGMTFLITGTLDGLDRKQGQALIEKHGGTLVKALKDKPTYVVMGVKPGPKKIQEVEEEQLEVLSQKELYRLIGIKGDEAKKGATVKAITSRSKGAKVDNDHQADGGDGDDDDEDDQDAYSGPPQGSPDALSGLSFLITGTLDGLDRKQGTALIYQHGGTMTSSLEQKPDYVIVGVRPGTKKVEEIERSRLTTLSQKQFFDLIRTGTGKGKGQEAKGGKKRGAAAAAAAAAADGAAPAGGKDEEPKSKKGRAKK